MSEDQLNLLKALFKEQDKKHQAQIKGVHDTIDSGLKVVQTQIQCIGEKINKVVDVNSKQQEQIDTIKKETSFMRIISKNPKTSIFTGLLLLMSISSFLTYLEHKDILVVIKKLVGL